ncbi:amphi-Trp domain-containing protein [Psychrobacter lutiphocae]|uniref:amphi-Trp domain-containing protein n=1 Tax=Psychrobacter lutiphocae TaxID=540500 RepID=UPI000374A004|nr:amphi-Trp domain-containing protein [Psychrobacter lutiphocae]
MGRETTLFKSKERRSKQEVVAFLRQLADKIEAGSLVLSKGKEELEVGFPENFTLEVEVEDEVKRKGVQHSLEVELKWYDGDNQKASGLVLK